MSHHDKLRYIMSACMKPQHEPKAEVVGSRYCQTFRVQMSQGRRAFEYAQMFIGKEAMSHTVRCGHKLELPRGFWIACHQTCFHRVCTDASRQSIRKSLLLYMNSLRTGATTICGMLAEKIRIGGDRMVALAIESNVLSSGNCCMTGSLIVSSCTMHELMVCYFTGRQRN